MKITRFVFAAMIAATIGAMCASSAEAQSSCGRRGTGTFVVTLSPSAVLFPSPGVADFLAGQIALPNPLQVSVNPQSGVGNSEWYVCVRSTDATLGGSGKPLGDLQFFNAQTGSWIPLTAAPAQLATFRGSESRTISVPIRMLLRWETDSPGTYGPTNLVFEFAR